jgi:hypothetical protein
MSVPAWLTPRRAAGALVALWLLRAVPVHAQEIPSAEEERAKRLGFYFSIAMHRLGARSFANGIGVEVDRPPVLGAPFSVTGPQVDGTFDERSVLGFGLGFRLRKDNGSIEADYFQWDQRQDLRTEPGDGKVIASSLASPLAGFYEDQGNPYVPGGLDGLVDGFEAGQLSERSEGPDGDGVRVVTDGAEDINYNGEADFIRFDTSDLIVGQLETDFQRLDVDYKRRVKKTRRFALEGVLGLRLATVQQNTDLAYRELGSFAVYIDDEGCPPTTPTCDEDRLLIVMDGDGDGETRTVDNEPDGDGFLDNLGDSNNLAHDRLESVDTVSEDRIVASIDTAGVGLKLGVNGTFELGRKWRLRGGVAVALMAADTAWTYRETFLSERDRYPNFIDWDLNGDGLYNNGDFDFDGSCDLNGDGVYDQGELAACGAPDVGDQNWVLANGGQVQVRMRSGAESSVVRTPSGLQSDAYSVAQGRFGIVRPGDPIPESERNTDVLRETSILHDVRGSSSDLLPMLDLQASVEYQFSRFAHVGFGLQSIRWLGAGAFRDLANDVVGGRGDELSGDFGLDGWFVKLTIVPR